MIDVGWCFIYGASYFVLRPMSCVETTETVVRNVWNTTMHGDLAYRYAGGDRSIRLTISTKRTVRGLWHIG